MIDEEKFDDIIPAQLTIQNVQTPIKKTGSLQFEPIEIKKLANLPKVRTSFDGRLNLISSVKRSTSIYLNNSHSDLKSKVDKERASIFWIGQAPFILEYKIDEDKWTKRDFDSNMTDYNGELSYSSSWQINHSHDYMLIGGVSLPSNYASNKWYLFRIDRSVQFKEKACLLTSRFSHSSVCLNDHVYAIGGITYNMENSLEVTLSSWEKYDIHSNKWEEISSLTTQRSHFGIAAFQSNYIYWFGGFDGVAALDTIEKYDALLDFWSQIVVKLPMKISNVGVAELTNNVSVVVLGGMFLDLDGTYSYLDTAYKMEFETEMIFKLPRMNWKRIWHSVMPHFEESIFALGGWKFNNSDDKDNISSESNNWEKYDVSLDRWTNISMYHSILPSNDLQSFALVLRSFQ